MSNTLKKSAALSAVLAGALLLQGCVVGAVVGATGAVVGGTAKATGAVIGAGVDAVTTSDEETRLKREREQRDYEREQRRCAQRRERGQDC